MLDPIIIIIKRTSSVVRRIDIDALDSSSKILLQRLECNQVVTVDQHVLAVRIAVGFLRFLKENARFDRLFLIIFANPGQLEFSFFLHDCIS